MAKTNRFNPDNVRLNVKVPKVDQAIVTQHTNFLAAKFAKTLAPKTTQTEAR